MLFKVAVEHKLVKYMGTREGVEKLPDGFDHRLATKKQITLICDLIEAYPPAWDYPEFADFRQEQSRGMAAEFIDAFIERNADRIDGIKKLVSYMGERPGVEKLGKHGLFSQTDDKIDLDAVAEEVSHHEGILWTHVVSLRREDAERLGYNMLTHGKNWCGATLCKSLKRTKLSLHKCNGMRPSITQPTIRISI